MGASWCSGAAGERGRFYGVPGGDLCELLLADGQDDLFDGWDTARVGVVQKRRVSAALQQLDADIPGGLVDYARRAKVLLEAARRGDNPMEGWVASVPTEGVVLDKVGSDAFAVFEKCGLEEMRATCFVLVAGGLGERLGFSGIKLALPCETSTGRSYLELYCAFLAAWGARSGVALPLAIMTSDDTHAATEALLKASGHFGLLASQITLLKQGKVAALRDAGRSSAAAATIAVDDGGIPLSKPHGHGDVHALLHSSGLAEGWLQAGCRHVVFFQDTNALALHAVPAAVGAARLKALDVNTITVCRRAKQAQGAVVSLKHADGRTAVANVEYNQLEPMLRAQGLEGDAADEKTGLSPFPGNTNCFVAALPAYAETLRSTQGAVPEFVNAKYADAERSDFVKPARMECMMQDFSRTLPPDKRVGFTTLPQWLSYSPVKNDSDAASALRGSGAPPTALKRHPPPFALGGGRGARRRAAGVRGVGRGGPLLCARGALTPRRLHRGARAAARDGGGRRSLARAANRHRPELCDVLRGLARQVPAAVQGQHHRAVAPRPPRLRLDHPRARPRRLARPRRDARRPRRRALAVSQPGRPGRRRRRRRARGGPYARLRLRRPRDAPRRANRADDHRRPRRRRAEPDQGLVLFRELGLRRRRRAPHDAAPCPPRRGGPSKLRRQLWAPPRRRRRNPSMAPHCAAAVKDLLVYLFLAWPADLEAPASSSTE